MAYPFQHTRSLFSTEDETAFNSLVMILKFNGVPLVIDFLCFDDDDLEALVGDDAVLKFCLKARSVLGSVKQGWASVEARRHLSAPSQPASRAEPSPHCDAANRSAMVRTAAPSSACSLSKSLRAASCGSLFRRKPCSAVKKEMVLSLANKKNSDMRKALDKVMRVFSKYAASSPRLRSLVGAPSASEEMQRDVYRMRSRSARVVAQRARDAESFFLEISTVGFDVVALSPLHVATWVRSRESLCASGVVNAGVRRMGHRLHDAL